MIQITNETNTEMKERIIKKTKDGWIAHLDNQSGSLILTNQRIILGTSKCTISLNDIHDIEIDTRFSDVTRISIDCKESIKHLEFGRSSPGHIANVLLGDSGWTHSEISSYTSYWASLLTMAKFLYGTQESDEKIGAIYEDKRVWCSHCDKYVISPWTSTPVWKIQCPECDRKGLLSLSPEDRKKAQESKEPIHH